MSSLMLEVPRPSPLRIGVGSGVIAAHVALLLMMSLTVSGEFELPARKVAAALDVVDIVMRPPAPPIPPPPMPVAPPRAPVIVAPRPVPVPLVPIESAFVVEAPVLADSLPDAYLSPGAAQGESDAATGGFAGLALLHAPAPPYPSRAKRLGLQGEVVLRIHVGADGLPREVSIVRGSGHAELDRGARGHVLRHWRFAPPPREAVGEVPIRFALL